MNIATILQVAMDKGNIFSRRTICHEAGFSHIR
jgi:hypothetical protein